MMSGQPGVGEEGKEFNFLKPNSIPAYLLAEKQAAESR